MSAYERSDPNPRSVAKTPRSPSRGLDDIVKGWEPTLRGLGLFNLEFSRLMSRRARAWLEIPMRLNHCKTPQDLITEQMRFWQTAASHYADGSHRLLATLGVLGVSNVLNGDDQRGGRPKRDTISFSGSEEPAPSAPSKGAERRAA